MPICVGFSKVKAHFLVLMLSMAGAEPINIKSRTVSTKAFYGGLFPVNAFTVQSLMLGPSGGTADSTKIRCDENLRAMSSVDDDDAGGSISLT